MTPPAPSLAAWYATSRWTQYQGHRVAYQNNGSESGRGAATVLIHGFPTASWDWHRVWPTLTSLGPLLAPDLLGFGYSAKPHPYPYSLRDQAQLILALCRQHNIKQVHVLAHDYGDSVAQELLALTQENRADDLEILSVYLLNGGIVPGQHRPRPVQKLLLSPLGPLVARCINLSTFRRSFAAVFGPQTQPDLADLAACWQLLEQHGGRRVMPAVSQYQRERRRYKDRWVNALRDASCPTGAYIGELDPVSGAHMADSLSRLCPDLHLTRDANIGHYPQLEAPDALSQAYLAFRKGDE